MGQQVAGEAKQVEFVLQHRGKEFVLRIGDKVAYRRPGAGAKLCALGRVTQVDSARAQVGLQQYLPDATGLRVKWRPAFLDEAGQLSTTEGTRPAVETVSVKDMITKIDLGNNGLIAAASARKLEKGGYHLQERAVQRGPPGPVVPDVSAALAVLLVHEEVVLQDCFAFEARGPKAAAALQWIKDGGAPAQFEFVEVAWGPAAVVGAASLLDRRSLLTISDGARALGVVWELSLPNDIAELSAVLGACSPRVTLFSFAEQGAPAELVELAVTMAQQSVESGRYFATALDCKSSLFEMWGYPSWGGCLGRSQSRRLRPVAARMLEPSGSRPLV